MLVINYKIGNFLIENITVIQLSICKQTFHFRSDKSIFSDYIGQFNIIPIQSPFVPQPSWNYNQKYKALVAESSSIFRSENEHIAWAH
jgi:hypothetical protein